MIGLGAMMAWHKQRVCNKCNVEGHSNESQQVTPHITGNGSQRSGRQADEDNLTCFPISHNKMPHLSPSSSSS